MNNEIVQSILSTYMALDYFTGAKFMYRCAAFCYLIWKFKCLAILRDICMWLNGYFMSSATAVLVRCPGRPPPIVIYHAQRPWAQARKPLGWSVCHLTHCHHCAEPTSWARKTSITSSSVIFSSLGSCYRRDRGICHHRTRMHRSLTRPAN